MTERSASEIELLLQHMLKFVNHIEEKAFEIKPPNHVTPEIVQICIMFRNLIHDFQNKR